MGGEFREWIHVYVWLSPSAVPSTALLLSYVPIKNKELKKKVLGRAFLKGVILG